jgi:hypothetical protein
MVEEVVACLEAEEEEGTKKNVSHPSFILFMRWQKN